MNQGRTFGATKRASAAPVLLALGLVGTLATVALWPDKPQSPRNAPQIATPVVPKSPPPVVVATELRPVTVEQALQINDAIPFETTPVAAAKPFLIAAEEKASGKALECLTAAVYYEAATESEAGQRAVAQVVLNRVRHPAFPASVCAVVYQGSERRTGCQFTFTCDGSLLRKPSTGGWARAARIAKAALSGEVFQAVGTATHYHANYVVPYWASSLSKSTAIGAHIFYRWKGGWGMPAAFRQRYAGAEPNISAMLAAKALTLSPDETGAPIPNGDIVTADAAVPKRYTTVVAADLEAGTLLAPLAPSVPEPKAKPKRPKDANLIADVEAGTLKADEGPTLLR